MSCNRKSFAWTLALCSTVCAVPSFAEEPGWVDPIDEVLCNVNNQKIGRRDVEARIGAEIMGRLEALKRQAIDEAEYQARFERLLVQIRVGPAWVKPDFEGLRTWLREQLLLQAFRNSLVTVLDLPKKPQIEKYYADHQERYVRPAAVKLRILTVKGDRKEPGGRNAIQIAQDLREDAAKFGANFEDLAREKSDDEETRPRGGLMLSPEGGPYIDPEANRILAPVVRRLRTGSAAERTSDVLALGNGWAIVFLEERRPAGPAELDSALYGRIREVLVQEVVKRKESEWFLEALKRSLILDGSSKPIPLAFFFPDDPTVVDGTRPSEQNTGTSARTTPSKER